MVGNELFDVYEIGGYFFLTADQPNLGLISNSELIIKINNLIGKPLTSKELFDLEDEFDNVNNYC